MLLEDFACDRSSTLEGRMEEFSHVPKLYVMIWLEHIVPRILEI